MDKLNGITRVLLREKRKDQSQRQREDVRMDVAGIRGREDTTLDMEEGAMNPEMQGTAGSCESQGN